MLGWCKYRVDKSIDDKNYLSVNILQAKHFSLICYHYLVSVSVCGISENKLLTCIYKTLVKAVQPALKYRSVGIYR